MKMNGFLIGLAGFICLWIILDRICTCCERCACVKNGVQMIKNWDKDEKKD